MANKNTVRLTLLLKVKSGMDGTTRPYNILALAPSAVNRGGGGRGEGWGFKRSVHGTMQREQWVSVVK